MLSEDDTRAKLIDPKLRRSGWSEEMIERSRRISPGRIIDESGNRKKGTEIDYILSYNSIPIAVVEAKPEGKPAISGMGQAKDDAKNYIHTPFAYSTNGHKIEEFDFTTNTQRSIERFPTPEELWERYLKYRFREKAVELRLDPLTYPYHHLPGGNTPGISKMWQ
jgi:type I restriction enzyme R subunit